MKPIGSRGREMLASLQAAQTPSDEVAARVWAALVSRAAAGDPGPEMLPDAVTQASTLAMGGIVAKTAVGLAFVAGVAVAVTRLPSAEAPVTAPPVPAPSAVQTVSTATPMPAPVLGRPNQTSEEDLSRAAVRRPEVRPREALPAAPLPTRSPDRSRARVRHAEPGIAEPRTVEASPVTPLAPEMALMAKARRALFANDPKQALVWLDRHLAEFRTGVFAEERQVSRIQALCALGRNDDASREAEAFLRQHPSSPLAPRARTRCGVATP